MTSGPGAGGHFCREFPPPTARRSILGHERLPPGARFPSPEARGLRGRVRRIPVAETGRVQLGARFLRRPGARQRADRKSTRLNSSHVEISYAVFCLKKKKKYILATT